MNDAGIKRGSGWKKVGLVLGCLLLVALALLLVTGLQANSTFERMHALARTRLTEVKARDGRRPVLRGTAEAGNAWDDYALAIAETKRFADARKLNDIVYRTPQADPAVAAAALANHGGAVEHLRKGAGRDSSRYPYEWEKGPAMEIPGMLDLQQLSHLALVQARAHFDAGKPREGVGVLLDVLQLGRDFGSDGLLISEMIGISLLTAGMMEIRDQLPAVKADRAALEDLARGLAVLDGSFPDHGRVLLNETLLFAGLADDKTIASWGLPRLFFADSMERTHGWMVRVGKAESLPWSEAQREYQAIEAEVQKAWNPVSQISTPSMLKTCKVVRERRAQVRMLRVAVAFLSGAELPDLDDPFGAKVRTAKTDGGLKIWSVGADGIDHGGTGEWKPEGQDIVLDVKK